MINCYVRRSVGIVLAADIFCQLFERIRGQMFVAFKHHVFEQMSEPAALIRVILGTDVIPNLGGNGRAGMIFDGVDLQTVRQRRVLHGNGGNLYLWRIRRLARRCD